MLLRLVGITIGLLLLWFANEIASGACDGRHRSGPVAALLRKRAWWFWATLGLILGGVMITAGCYSGEDCAQMG